MASHTALPDFVQAGFNHRRMDPELPPGYDWKTQIKKYCPRDLPRFLKAYGRRKFGSVFCHRGFYHRAMKVPENSRLAIENGIGKGMMLYEVDARMDSDHPVHTFLAHEVANRVTSKTRRWTSLNISDIMETALVTRRFDVERDDFASSYQDTDEKVPHLEDALNDGVDMVPDPRFLLPGGPQPEPEEFIREDGRCLQLDLRGNDFLKAIAFFHKRPFDINKVLLKGYNFEIFLLPGPGSSCHFRGCETAIAIRMVQIHSIYYNGVDPDTASPVDRSSLGFQEIRDTAMKQVLSFIGKRDLVCIPEIACSGLGLGYNVQTGHAVNPLDGTTITDPAVILESCVDRAMMEVSLELRSIHGGLFSQSDLIVADDPLAEIAARTWIDEYAKLDRSKLLGVPYFEWLAQAGPAVVAAVKILNDPFLLNTFDGPLDDNWNIKVEKLVT
ncbi:MAG: hypothetical protein M1822_000723 [Bathelium mastoideum]|nr:MAG: hypothetical protein M1822_000723 [Bathelium mastoideum]